MGYIRHLGNIPKAEAEDILQEAFLKVWKNLNNIDVSMKFSSWLFRVVHNQAISHLRKRSAFNRGIESFNEDLDSADKAQQVPDTERASGIEVRSVHHILDMLPVQYKEVLVLKFLENMSYEEISDVLRIPEGTVAIRISRAKKQFRKLAEGSPDFFNSNP